MCARARAGACLEKGAIAVFMAPFPSLDSDETRALFPTPDALHRGRRVGLRRGREPGRERGGGGGEGEGEG